MDIFFHYAKHFLPAHLHRPTHRGWALRFVFQFLVSLIFQAPFSFIATEASFAQTNSAEQQFQQGLALLQAKKYDDAIAAFTAALKLQPTHDAAYQKRAEAYQKKIIALNGAGQYEEALSLVQTALANSIRSDDFKNRSWLFKLRGNASFRLGNYDQALAAYQQSLEAAQKSGERTFEADAENGMALVYQFTGDFQKAIVAFNRTAELYRRLGDKDGHGIVLANLGDTYQLMGEYERATSFYEQALPLLREIGDRRNEAATLDAMAAAHAYQGWYAKSDSLNRIALQIYRETGDRGGESNVLGNIGENHLERGNYWEGLKYLTHALAISTALKEKYKQQIQLGAIGNAYYWLGDYNRAAEALQRSQQLAHEIGDVASEAIRIGDLGSVQRELGQNESAMKSFQQALALCDTLGDKRGQAVYSADIGVMHTLAENYDQALLYLNRGLELHQEIENKLGEGEANNYLGSLYLQTGDYPRAKQAHETALTIGKSLRAAKIIWEARYGLAQLAEREGKFAEAKALYQSAITSVEATRARLPLAEHKAYFLAGRDQIYKSLIHLLGQRHQQQPQAGFAAEAFLYAEKAKARALLDLLAEAKIDLDQSLTPEQKERQNAAWQRIADLQTKLSQSMLTEEERKALEEELAQTEKTLQDLAAEIRQQNPAYAHLNPQPLSLAEAQKKILEQNELVLAYSLGEEKSYLWAITAGWHFFYPLPPEREIERTVNAYAHLINDPKKISAAHFAASRELYNLILLPADSLLQRTKKLVIIADGILHNVPFEALVTPAKERQPKYLIQHAEITYAPSATVLALLNANDKNSPARAPKTLLAFADPFFGASESQQLAPTKRGIDDSLTLRGVFEHLGVKFPRLKSAGAEIDSIARFFAPSRRTIYRRKEAKEEQVKRENLRRYTILHFATHGVLDAQHPERSCVVLALDDEPAEDGFLQMHEIYKLNLNAELVVLSACQTSRGQLVRGEGLISLGRAFLYAGAKSVLGTLWSVADDPSSVKLMGKFYDYLQHGKTRGEALRQAKLDLINGKTAAHRHPFYWAGFVLMGSDR